ncbi:hypothetical protein CA830_28985, partial [Burkholderia multivorans]
SGCAAAVAHQRATSIVQRWRTPGRRKEAVAVIVIVKYLTGTGVGGLAGAGKTERLTCFARPA